MSNELPRGRTLESLKKEAKRWLSALRSNAADARARFERALSTIPDNPTLRDVQHALAREYGFDGWTALKQSVARANDADNSASPNIARYEEMAAALLDAYRTGAADAMVRHYALTWHRRAWPAMRTYVQLDLGRRPSGPDDPVDITLDDARYLVSREHGFPDWNALVTSVGSHVKPRRMAAKPARVEQHIGGGKFRGIGSSRDWDEIRLILASNPTAVLRAEGQMTDDVLAELATMGTLTSLDLSGSKALTDDGLRRLANLPQLKFLNLSGTGVTDSGLSVLRDLPDLEMLALSMTEVTDAGAAEFAHCRKLTRVNLMWTYTGDGALRALAGLPVQQFASGNNLTDAGLKFLHDLPVFASPISADFAGGARIYGESNQLTLRGNITDRGMEQLRGLDGLYALNIDDRELSLTAAAMVPLISLDALGSLSADAKDDWMPHIAKMPRLRALGIQDTQAGDDGWVALGKSQSIERIWGRRCHNLRDRGFRALSKMPALNNLAVSCLNVSDDGVAELPNFPALRELMPMDVPDAGYRHIARCRDLERLVLMYCRDTTDVATEHIHAGLRKLSSYFNSYTTITDRTPDLLSQMDSLEAITFDTCHGLTNEGVARLARLPGLKDLRVSGRQITSAVRGFFAPGIVGEA